MSIASRASIAVIAFAVAFAGPGAAVAAPTRSARFLEEGDQLRIRVFNVRGALELDLRETVRKGRIFLPLLGRIETRNRTVRDLRNRIREDMAASFLKEPFVSVEMDREIDVLFRGPFLPRVLRLPYGTPLLLAVGRLGWQKPCREVRVRRGHAVQSFTLRDLERLFEKGGPAVHLREGDVVELLP